jgi:hypothetical protein
MSKIHITTRGPCNWRERLGDPEVHWKRRASAMETSVSWENSARSPSGVPEPVRRMFQDSEFGAPKLLLAIAEHKVPLKGAGGAAQCDVWALIKAQVGTVSLAVEAKAQEPFGKGNETLEAWLESGESAASKPNRKIRWECIQKNLPLKEAGSYHNVPYQILQRCAAAVIEARRFGLRHAAFVVQSFSSPKNSFKLFAGFCRATEIDAEPNQLKVVAVADIRLGIGWADCPFASDAELASLL